MASCITCVGGELEVGDLGGLPIVKQSDSLRLRVPFGGVDFSVEADDVDMTAMPEPSCVLNFNVMFCLNASGTSWVVICVEVSTGGVAIFFSRGAFSAS